MLIDIVILPPAKLRRKMGGKMKKETVGYPTVFVVDDKKMIPHLSLWHLKTSKNRIDGLAVELRNVVQGQRPIKISSAGFVASKKENGIVNFLVKNNKFLALLRKKVFEKTHPFKTGMMPQLEVFGLWKGKTLMEGKKYGRPLALNPHFTMGFLKKTEDALKIEEAMKKEKFSFVAKEIYICEVNHWWQVIRVLKKIDFRR